jgi:Tfp pilus assembly protein PilF
MLGFITSGERKYEESNKYLLAASKISPSLPDPYLYLGLNAFSQEKMDIAEKMMRKAVEMTGSDEGRANYQIRRAYVDLARILFAGARRRAKFLPPRREYCRIKRWWRPSRLSPP